MGLQIDGKAPHGEPIKLCIKEQLCSQYKGFRTIYWSSPREPLWAP